MKRGQSALEYLVTYGWAILVIVIIAGVLWYFGVFNPSQFAGDKQCGGFGGFVCQDFKVNTTGDLTIVLNNKVGGSVLSADVGGTGSCTAGTITANANMTCIQYSTVSSGATGNVVDRTSVSITYTDSRSGIAHTDTGFVRGKIE